MKEELSSWIVALIDTGMGLSDLICCCIDENFVWYDHRVQEQYPNVNEKILTKVIDEMIEDGMLKCDDFYLKVNWEKWRAEKRKFPDAW